MGVALALLVPMGVVLGIPMPTGIRLLRERIAKDLGEVVAFLASERASYVSGATIQVDGGLIQGTF